MVTVAGRTTTPVESQEDRVAALAKAAECLLWAQEYELHRQTSRDGCGRQLRRPSRHDDHALAAVMGRTATAMHVLFQG
jgi:hypothetical protein